MDTPELDLTFIPAPDDPPLKSSAYQSELQRFEQDLNSNGLEVSYTMEVRESWTPEPILAPYLGDFAIKLINSPIVGVLVGAVGAWLHARAGRKVRLKIGEIEAEAQTMEQVERLLARGFEIQQGSQRKVIS